MKILIIFLVGVAIGFWLGKNRKELRSNPPAGEAGNYELGANSQKEERKKKIMTVFYVRDDIRNDDVEKMLGVSDATATNYLSELEKEGKIEQVGAVGRFVTYRKRS